MMPGGVRAAGAAAAGRAGPEAKQSRRDQEWSARERPRGFRPSRERPHPKMRPISAVAIDLLSWAWPAPPPTGPLVSRAPPGRGTAPARRSTRRRRPLITSRPDRAPGRKGQLLHRRRKSGIRAGLGSPAPLLVWLTRTMRSMGLRRAAVDGEAPEFGGIAATFCHRGQPGPPGPQGPPGPPAWPDPRAAPYQPAEPRLHHEAARDDARRRRRRKSRPGGASRRAGPWGAGLAVRRAVAGVAGCTRWRPWRGRRRPGPRPGPAAGRHRRPGSGSGSRRTDRRLLRTAPVAGSSP